jgi:hypothetical protein
MMKENGGKCGRKHSAPSESDSTRIDYAKYVRLKQKEFMREGQEVEGE